MRGFASGRRLAGTPPLLVLALGLAASASAQVVLDGTIGDAGPGLVLPGTDDQGQAATYLIHDGLGEQSGGNLYFSFDAFSIGAGETATFMSDSLTPVDLVMSRVTGGSLSQIDGTLRSTIPGAAIFLMNPAGVAFGAGSSLDIPGSLHIATSEYLRHTDGSRFVATAMPPTALSTAPIDAFGFLNAEVGDITVEETLLELSRGQTLSLVGGDIEVLGFPAGAAPDFENRHSAIRVPSGRVNLAAVASAGEVVFDDSRADPRLDVDSFETLGNIRFAEQASLSVNGNPGGTIVVRGRDLEVSDDSPERIPFESLGGLELLAARIALDSVTVGDGDHLGLGVDIDLRGDLVLDNAGLNAWTLGEGRGGNIRIRADGVSITGPVSRGNTDLGIHSFTAFPGNAGDSGDVELEADHIDLFGHAIVASRSFFSRGLDRGNAGDVTVIVRALTADGVKDGDFLLNGRELPIAGVLSITSEGSSGRGGDLVIHADKIDLVDAGWIAATSITGATGAAGSVTILTRKLDLGNGLIGSLTTSSGNADSTRVTAAEDINIFRSGSITGITHGSGNGGSVTVRANHILVTENSFIAAESVGPGDAGSVDIIAGDITINERSTVTTSSTSRIGSGDGGSIRITAGEIDIVGVPDSDLGESPFTAVVSEVRGSGGAGSIEVNADRLTLRDWAVISTGTCGAGNSGCGGAGGDITITAEELELLGAAIIDASTRGTGDGGAVTIRAGSLLLSGVAENPIRAEEAGLSPLSARALVGSVSALGATGNAGPIKIDADQVHVLDGGVIVSNSFGDGGGGAVTVTADDILVSGESTKLENALLGPGVDPELARDLSRSSISAASVKGFPSIAGTDDAGSVRLQGGANSELVVADGGAVFSITNTPGAGGSVEIDLARVTVRDGGLISTRSYEGSSGDAGSITIRTEWFTAENGGSVTAASAETDAGDIEIQGGDRIELLGGVVETSVDGGSDTTGGNIQLAADIVVVDGESRLVAEANEGQGGNILITAQGYFEYPGADVSASSEFGVDGTVVVNTPEANLTAALAALSERYRAADLAPDQCAAGAGTGSFVLGNATGVPEAPDAPLPSFSLAGLGPP